MSIERVLFRVSLGLALVGGSLAVLLVWLLSQPSDPYGGVNIGAGFLIYVATGLMEGYS